MKPAILATADRIDPAWAAEPRILRFQRKAVPEQRGVHDRRLLDLFAWLVILLVPMLAGGIVLLKLGEPLLGVISAMFAMLPLIIAFCPRQTSARGRR